MKVRTVAPFTKWLLKRMFGKVIYVYNLYDEFVVDNPGLAILPTVLISVGFSMFATLGLVINGMFFPTGFWFILLGIAVIFSNYVRIVLRELYKDFKRERKELFETIKG